MKVGELILSGTGHRPEELGGYGEDTLVKLTDFAISFIPDYKPTKLISGMALGWDQAVAMAAVELGIPWIAAIPFKGQENIWPEAVKAFYQDLILKATEVVTVCEGGYAPWKMQKRNEWMVNNAHGMLALWNGKREGGTFNCIEFASKKQKPIYNVWKEWEEWNEAA